MRDAERLRERFGLVPHPEGGWYRNTYTSDVPVHLCDDRGTRPAATLIHYLLDAGEESAWHVVASDEVWLWQLGGPLELRLGGSGAEPDGTTAVELGPEPGTQQLQSLVPAGTWQTARPLADEPVLLGVLVSPGFDFADFRTRNGG